MKLYYECELKHHGIKGQKWGVRRFQNKDGTLTAKGKKRYSDSSEDIKNMSDDELRSRINRLRNEKKYIDLTKKTSKVSKIAGDIQKKGDVASKAIDTQKNVSKMKGVDISRLETAGQGVKVISKSASMAKKIDKMASEPKHVKKAVEKLNNMSDDELRTIVTRLDLEKQFSDISRETRTRGKVTVGEVLDVAGDALAIAASITGIAVGVKALMKS